MIINAVAPNETRTSLDRRVPPKARQSFCSMRDKQSSTSPRKIKRAVRMPMETSETSEREDRERKRERGAGRRSYSNVPREVM